MTGLSKRMAGLIGLSLAVGAYDLLRPAQAAVQQRAASAGAQGGAESRCAALVALSLPGASISLARVYEAGDSPVAATPRSFGAFGGRLSRPICRVTGTIRSEAASEIGFEVWMPTSGWNGKYNGVGNGGAAGFIATTDIAKAVDRGYAAGSTDTGHRAFLADGGWMFDNPVAVTDFGHRSQHLTARTAKAVVTAFYGSKPAHAYFTGCSNGGGQGLSEAQRYPEDYDGIVSGDAAAFLTREWPGELYMTWATRASRDTLIDKLSALHAAVIAQCDPIDGLKDGLIDDPRRCRFDPAVLQCAPGSDARSCLTSQEVASVRKVYVGLRDARSGGQIWPGSAPGSEPTWAGKIKPNLTPLPQSYMRAFVFHDRNWTYTDPAFDFESRATAQALAAAGAAHGRTLNADSPDLRAFARRGGRILMYHGWADTDISPFEITRYYDRMARVSGGSRDGAARFARLFMVPGMAHCGGGYGPNQFDALAALERWVERGEAPDRIIASRSAGNAADQTRPLCPYPKSAIYKGSGSVDDAANFTCSSR